MPSLACADASPSYASEPRIAIAYVTLCVLALAVRLGLIATLVRLRTAACSAQHGLLRPGISARRSSAASKRESSGGADRQEGAVDRSKQQAMKEARREARREAALSTTRGSPSRVGSALLEAPHLTLTRVSL